jgi:large subunit ribosomal protein L31
MVERTLLLGPLALPLTPHCGYIYLLRLNLRNVHVKPDLHPSYKKLTAVCACGNSFETRSTAASIHVEVCAQCHPYFTGKQRLVDTAGRVDRFRRKYQTEPAAAPKA